MKTHFISVTRPSNSFSFLFSEQALTISFPDNRLPSKIDAKVPTIVRRNPPFCSFVSLLIVSVTPLNKIL